MKTPQNKVEGEKLLSNLKVNLATMFWRKVFTKNTHS